MKPNTDRPAACAIDGQIYVFVGGCHQVMSIPAAESLIAKISEAISQTKAPANEEPKP